MSGIIQHGSLHEAMADSDLLGPFFSGESWQGWRTIAKAAFGVPLDEEETAFFRSIAERDPPKRRVRELHLTLGRRAGKDSFASGAAAWYSGCVDFRG
jgi:hypothetical protein